MSRRPVTGGHGARGPARSQHLPGAARRLRSGPQPSHRPRLRPAGRGAAGREQPVPARVRRLGQHRRAERAVPDRGGGTPRLRRWPSGPGAPRSLAYKHAYYDLAGKHEVTRRIAAERGTEPALGVFFNDLRMRSRELADAVSGRRRDTPAELPSPRAELAPVDADLGRAQRRARPTRCSSTIIDTPDTLCYELWTDSHFVSSAGHGGAHAADRGRACRRGPPRATARWGVRSPRWTPCSDRAGGGRRLRAGPAGDDRVARGRSWISPRCRSRCSGATTGCPEVSRDTGPLAPGPSDQRDRPAQGPAGGQRERIRDALYARNNGGGGAVPTEPAARAFGPARARSRGGVHGHPSGLRHQPAGHPPGRAAPRRRRRRRCPGARRGRGEGLHPGGPGGARDLLLRRGVGRVPGKPQRPAEPAAGLRGRVAGRVRRRSGRAAGSARPVPGGGSGRARQRHHGRGEKRPGCDWPTSA